MHTKGQVAGGTLYSVLND